MHSKSENIEIMIIINDKPDKVIEKLFETLLLRYRIGSETLMRGSDFSFDCVQFFYYEGHKINLK